MVANLNTLKIVVALAQDVPEGREDLVEAVDKLNRTAREENRNGLVEIIAWWEEGSQSAFYLESPRRLIETINQAHHPDIIIGVFWQRFGTETLGAAVDIEQEFRLANQEWSQDNYPHVMLYFLNETPKTRDKAWLNITTFKGALQYEKFWWHYKKRSTLRQTRHAQELSNLVYEHLLKFVRRWKPEGAEVRVEKRSPNLVMREEEWRLIRQRELNELRAGLDSDGKLKIEDAVSYFNGEEPKLKYVVSQSIPRRKAVEKIKDRISEAASERRMHVTLLIGPGGEGKSTILQQVAVDLTDHYPGIHVIWQQKVNVPLDKSLIQQLLGEPDSFVIICDNAAFIAQEVYETARRLSDKPRINVQFLLSSQTTEWQWNNAPPEREWLRTFGKTKFFSLPVNKLELADAQRIVEKWNEAGPEGLGVLAQIPEADRPQHLVNLAYEEEINNPNEGPLLGAILLARKDDAILQGFVENILARLKTYQLPGDRTLRDVFAYIAVLHADMAALRADIAKARPNEHRIFPKPVTLSKPILARLLSCSPKFLEEEIIAPLADEAAVSRSEYFVLVRHRRIAEVAKRFFTPTRLREIYCDLLRAARITFLPPIREIDGQEIDPWNKLPRFYFEGGQLDLALDLAKVLAEVEPYDPIPVVSWAHIYRDAKMKREAANIFRGRFDILWEHWKNRKPDNSNRAYLNKGYFSEWSVSEGQIDKHCYSTWLCGIALSDTLDERRSGDTPFMMLLSELTSSLKRLYEKAADPNNATFNNSSHADTFLRACAAAAWLGLDSRAQKSLKPNFNFEQAKRNLKTGKQLGIDHHVQPITQPDRALELLYQGINLAWTLRDKDEKQDENGLPEMLPDFTDLHFEKLSALFEDKSVQG